MPKRKQKPNRKQRRVAAKTTKKLRPGVALETIVARVQQMMDPKSEVTHNQTLTDRIGNDRQFDVVIRGTFAGRPMLGVIECKDHNRKKGPDAVEAFAKKSENLGANMRVMVSRKGFTKQAMKVAKHESIGCLSLLPNDPRQAGFSVGMFWYGVIREWTEARLTVRFDLDRAPVGDFKSEQVKWKGLPVVRWFLRELFEQHAHDKTAGTWKLPHAFREVRMLEINGQEYPVKELVCEAVWYTAKKRRWVSWSGDAYYDWHRQTVCLPSKATLVSSPVPTDIHAWDDYDGEIPERPSDKPGEGLLVVGYFRQKLSPDEEVPELGDL